MSWSTRTWQPPVRRDGPLVVVAAFFFLPCLFFITAWYADYFEGATPMVVSGLMGAVALLAPAVLCFQMAGRAGRRRALWAALVLAGSAMALWLPAQHLMRDGPLPPGAGFALLDASRRVLATTFVAFVPMLAGLIPVALYGLAPGQDRPLAGIPPRGAVLILAGTGVTVWAATLFFALLNPITPPLLPLIVRVEAVVTVERAPALPAELEPATWSALLWRLHDGLHPGATDLARENGNRIRMRLPLAGQRLNLAALLVRPGLVEFVDAGDSPPTTGTSISTSSAVIGPVEDLYETVITGEQFQLGSHWSGATLREVVVEEETEASVLTITLNEEGREMLARFAESNPEAFLTLVSDNVVFASFPVEGAIVGNSLVVRRLEPEIAKALAAIMRYGRLPLAPQLAFDP